VDAERGMADWNGLRLITTPQRRGPSLREWVVREWLIDTNYLYYRRAPGRYYRRRFTADEFNDNTDLRIETTAKIDSSIGTPAATCVQFTTPGGRTFGLGFLRDDKAPGKDQVILYADDGKPLKTYGLHYNWVDWLWKVEILGSYAISVNEKRTYILELLRNGKGGQDDEVRLSIPGCDLEPLTARLSELPTRPTVPGLVFGHPSARGGGKARWYGLTIGTTGRPRPADLPRRIGNKRQLFLDDWIIQKMDNVERRLERPEKYAGNPVLRTDKPWDAGRLELINAPIWDAEERKLKLFYMGAALSDEPGRHHEARFRSLYAESAEGGRTWTKPDLGLVEFAGHKSNNIVPGSGGYIFLDEWDADPTRRYKAFGNGYHAALSSDGFHWRPLPLKPAMEVSSDTDHAIFWDGCIGRYVSYVRMRETPPGGESGRRAVGRVESSDFEGWSPPELVFGDPQWHVYSMGVTPYEGIYIGTPWFYWEGSKDPDRHDPVISPGIAVSRDAWAWRMLTDPRTKEEYIRTGPPGSSDDRQVRMVSRLIVLDDEILFFYGQNADPHDTGVMRTEGCLATLRLDGFMPVVAGEKTGRLLTKPFMLEGDKVYLNAACEVNGSITVAVLDEAGRPVPGLMHEQCQPVRGDSVKLPVRWQGEAALAQQRAKTIRLEFALAKARLYSFWCEK